MIRDILNAVNNVKRAQRYWREAEEAWRPRERPNDEITEAEFDELRRQGRDEIERYGRELLRNEPEFVREQVERQIGETLREFDRNTKSQRRQYFGYSGGG